MLKNAIEFMKRYWHDSIKPWILRKTKFESRKRWWSEKCKPWILKNRTYSLVLAGLIGIVLAIVTYWSFCLLKHSVLRSSLTILALGLPTFFVLWLLRTHDVQRQIDKTEENTNNSTFFECVKMLTDTKRIDEETALEQFRLKRIAFEQLIYLRKENSFNQERINILTRGINLEDLDLSHADFEWFRFIWSYVGIS